MSRCVSWLLVSAAAGLLLVPMSVLAGDPVRGQEKTMTCQACHGPDGNSPNPIHPILAGQHRDYLLQTMRDYKSGARANPIMKVIVEPLSDVDLQDLAAYYASQEGLREIDVGRLKEIP